MALKECNDSLLEKVILEPRKRASYIAFEVQIRQVSVILGGQEFWRLRFVGHLAMSPDKI
jgi:hypothetical protein